MTADRSAAAQQRLASAEHLVERQSDALNKELRLHDLVGMQILNIVGLFWVGTAGKLGSAHLMFWLPAVLLFYIPSGIVVAHLVKEMPLEGGLYQWAKLRFSPLIGFLVAIMFIAGTASVLAFSRPESIDLVSPMTQVLNDGAPQLVALSAVVLIAALLAQSSLGFSTMIRLPMVTGWDHLLPAWFSRLDPRYRTPVGSVIFAGAVGAVIIVLTNLWSGNQEAFQLLDNSGGILYGFTYLVMFAIPLIAKGEKPSAGVRLAALSGLAMTVLYVLLSVFPIIQVQNSWLFTAKIIGLVDWPAVFGRCLLLAGPLVR